MTCGLIAFLAIDGHAMAASVTYRVTVAWTTNRVTGNRRQLRNTGSSGDRPSVSVRIPVHREHSFRFNVNARSGDGEHRFRSS